MTTHSAAELGTTYDCKVPSCTGETTVIRGRFAYLCDEHRAIAVREGAAAALQPQPQVSRGTFADKVKELDRAAKLADRTRAEAVKATEKALEAKAEADARELEFRALARELMGDADPGNNGHG